MLWYSVPSAETKAPDLHMTALTLLGSKSQKLLTHIGQKTNILQTYLYNFTCHMKLLKVGSVSVRDIIKKTFTSYKKFGPPLPLPPHL